MVWVAQTMEPAQLLKESDDMKFLSNALRIMEETALSRRSRIAEPLPQIFLKYSRAGYVSETKVFLSHAHDAVHWLPSSYLGRVAMRHPHIEVTVSSPLRLAVAFS